MCRKGSVLSKLPYYRLVSEFSAAKDRNISIVSPVLCVYRFWSNFQAERCNFSTNSSFFGLRVLTFLVFLLIVILLMPPGSYSANYQYD